VFDGQLLYIPSVEFVFHCLFVRLDLELFVDLTATGFEPGRILFELFAD
jgi:hypothetical protein